jgi:putative NADH-flavin reductase
MKQVANTKRILILGAAGRVGQHLTRKTLKRGYEVTVIVRDRSKIQLDHHSKLNVIEGDLNDRKLLSDTFNAHFDAVLSCLGVFHKTRNTPIADITQNLIEVMEAHNCLRFICMSSLGVGDSKGQGNIAVKYVSRFILKYVFFDKELQEKRLRSSQLQWSITRPPQLLDEEFSAQYQVWQGTDHPKKLKWKISTQDAAEDMIRLLEDDNSIHKAYQCSY